MNWAAAFYAATVWILAASFWQLYRPLPADSTHRYAAVRMFQDLVPAVLIGLLAARIL